MLANASAYLEAFGHIVLAWIWLEQAEAAAGNPGDFTKASCKRQGTSSRPNFRRLVSIALLRSLDRTSLDMRANWF